MFGFDTNENFFHFYKETYHAVKAIDQRFTFGTPSLLFLPEDPLGWYHPFFNFCAKESCFPDFINIHYYDDDIELIDATSTNACILNKLSNDPDSFSKYLDTLFENADSFGLTGLPVYMTEWNLTVSHRNFINDTCFKACYLTKNLLENYDRIDAFGYWMLTDYIGEMQLSPKTFHGGLGMFTYSQIPKAHYHAFCLISRLGAYKISSGSGWFLTKQSPDSDYQLILYNYYHFDDLFASGELFDMTDTNRYTAFSDLKPLHMAITLQALPNGHYRITETYVNRQQGSCYDTWIQMGALEPETPAEINYLKQQSQPGIYLSETEVVDGSLIYGQTLEPFEVRLIEFKKI